MFWPFQFHYFLHSKRGKLDDVEVNNVKFGWMLSIKMLTITSIDELSVIN